MDIEKSFMKEVQKIMETCYNLPYEQNLKLNFENILSPE